MEKPVLMGRTASVPTPQPRSSCRLDQRGLSLIEVLVATAILAIAIIPLYSAIGHGFKYVIAGREAAVGMNLLERAIEETKQEALTSFPPQDIPNGGNTGLDYGSDQDIYRYNLTRTVTLLGWMDSIYNQQTSAKVLIKITKGNRTVSKATFLIHKKGL